LDEIDINKNKLDESLILNTQVQQSISLPPHIIALIHDSIKILFKDKNLHKEILQEIFANQPQALRDIIKDFLYNNPQIIKGIISEFFLDHKELLNTSISNLSSNELVLQDIDKESAKKEIIQFIESHEGCLPSEIIEELKIDPNLVIEILKELKEQNLLESKAIE
jgi:hypothetical protein